MLLNKKKRFTVVLDPGHGGSDPGAVALSGLKESEMALDVCQRAQVLLNRYVNCLLTRNDDKTFLSLAARPAFANKNHANVFVSYHFNSSARLDVPNAWEIFTTRGQNRSDRLATEIGLAHAARFPQQKHRSDFSDGDLDKEANHVVTRMTNCPSALMEGEFINTPHGEALIKDPANRHLMAEALAIGIFNFLKIPYVYIPREMTA